MDSDALDSQISEIQRVSGAHNPRRPARLVPIQTIALFSRQTGKTETLERWQKAFFGPHTPVVPPAPGTVRGLSGEIDWSVWSVLLD